MIDKKYIALLTEIKQKIKEAQVKTVMAANSQMLLLYWQLGNFIIQNQQQKRLGGRDHWPAIQRLKKRIYADQRILSPQFTVHEAVCRIIQY